MEVLVIVGYALIGVIVSAGELSKDQLVWIEMNYAPRRIQMITLGVTRAALWPIVLVIEAVFWLGGRVITPKKDDN